MADTQTIKLALDDHFLDDVKGSALKGIKELIWNSLDADATEIEVSFARGVELDGITEVRVVDDGHGFRQEDIASLYGSSKQKSNISPKGRKVHGSTGKGRYVIFGCGGTATWTVVYADSETGKHFSQVITCSSDSPTDLTFTTPLETDAPTGTRFVLSGVSSVIGVEKDKVLGNICETFAIALRSHVVTLKYDGDEVDASSAIAHEEKCELGTFDGEKVSMLFVEWSGKGSDKSIHLCDEADISRSEITSGLPAADFAYTAYVNWPGIGNVELPTDMKLWDPIAAEILEAATSAVKEHIKRRKDDENSRIIDKWVEEDAYPFDRDKTDESKTEEIAREAFDVVAVAAAPYINENKSAKGRKFNLRVLKTALENNPGDIEHLIQELLNLTDEQRADFKKLLDRTSLGHVIAASKAVTDRIDFLQALRFIVMDKSAKKAVNERDHLHKMLELEPWVFGDEFSTCISEENLKSLVKQCVSDKNIDDLLVDDPMVDHTGSDKRRFDLLLPLSIPQNDPTRRFLVVELKRPSHKISLADYHQLDGYMHALIGHNLYKTSSTYWDFMIVGDELADEIYAERNEGQPGLIKKVAGDRVRVWAFTWAEVLQSAEYRTKYIQEQLAINASDDDALKLLKTKHGELIPDAVREMSSAKGKSE